jgi:hypothetical protein
MRTRLILLVVAVFVLVAVGYEFLTERASFSTARLLGAPVIATAGPRPVVVIMTEHVESRRIWDFSQDFWITKQFRHLDLLAFGADDFVPLWTRRLETIAGGISAPAPDLFGIEDGTVWALGTRLHAIALADGRLVGTEAEITARSTALAGKFPRDRRFFRLDAGLVATVSDGTRWRIDPKTLEARPDSGDAMAGTSLSRPMPRNRTFPGLKARSLEIGGNWYGLIAAEELPGIEASMRTTGLRQGEVREPDYNIPRRYRLYSARVNRIVHPTFQTTHRILNDIAPAPASPEFLLGGLLVGPGRPGAADTRNQDQVIGIVNPTRLLVLHQDRIDEAARLGLACIGLDGAVCWQSELGLSRAERVAMLARGKPEDWALILAGVITVPNAPNADVIVRVSVLDGKTRALNVAAFDMGAMAATLPK